MRINDKLVNTLLKEYPCIELVAEMHVFIYYLSIIFYKYIFIKTPNQKLYISKLKKSHGSMIARYVLQTIKMSKCLQYINHSTPVLND